MATLEDIQKALERFKLPKDCITMDPKRRGVYVLWRYIPGILSLFSGVEDFKGVRFDFRSNISLEDLAKMGDEYIEVYKGGMEEKVEYLDLSGAEICNPAFFKGFKRLKVLKLSSIGSGPTEVKDLLKNEHFKKSIEELSAGHVHNCLETITEYQNLRHLTLLEYGLESYSPFARSRFKNSLEYLDISHTYGGLLNIELFKGYSRIIELNLSHILGIDDLSDLLDCEFVKNRSLRKLDLRGTPIWQDDKAGKALKELREQYQKDGVELEVLIDAEFHYEEKEIDGFPSLPTLKGQIDEASYAALKGVLDIELDREASPIGIQSLNKVFTATHPDTGDEMVVKVTRNSQKAHVEAAANYFLSQDEQLGNGIINKGYYPKPIKYGNIFITLQKKKLDKNTYSAYFYVAALALLHARAEKHLTTDRIVLPEYEAKEWEDIFYGLACSEGARFFGNEIGPRYKQLESELPSSRFRGIGHRDTKPDNLGQGSVFDLENMSSNMPHAIDLAMPLVFSGEQPCFWNRFIKAYLDVKQQETGSPYTEDDLVQLTTEVKRLAVIPCSKELGGLCERMRGNGHDPRMRFQAGTLRHFLRDVYMRDGYLENAQLETQKLGLN